MKVLQINAKYGYSSTGVIVKDIGDAVVKNGGQAFYAYQTCTTIPDNGYRVGNKLDWKRHAFLCRLFGKQAYFSKKATKRLTQYISSVEPDIVHLHNLHSNYIHLNLLLRYLAKKNIPTVITMHDCWYFTGKCFHYADIGCDRFQTGCGACPKKKAPQKSLFFDCSCAVLRDKYAFLSAVPKLILVGCSRWVCEQAGKSVLKDLPIQHIYNGVDIEIFKPYDNSELYEKYGIMSDDRIIMGMANKWLEPNNALLLAQTVRMLDEKTKLLLVGCTESQMAYLKKLTRYIIPVGFIKDRTALAKLYSMATVFVNATHADTLPTVNMESVCSGTPVITYNSCGSPELVLEGCGKVISENDVAAMVLAMRELSGTMTDDALKNARNQFDKTKCYQKYIEVYEKLLG